MWPREYAQQILNLKTVEERRKALLNVPAPLRDLVKKHVEIAWDRQKHRGNKP